MSAAAYRRPSQPAGSQDAQPAPAPLPLQPSGSHHPARRGRYTLSDLQESVIRLLAEGVTIADAATHTGIHRSTIYNWQQTNPLFATRLNESRHEIATHCLEQFHARADKALATIDRLLDDPATPASVQARLALAVINAAATPLDPAKILAQAFDYSINAPMPGQDEASRYRSSGLARPADDPATFDEEDTDSIEPWDEHIEDPCTAKSGETPVPGTNVRHFSTNSTSFSSNGTESATYPPRASALQHGSRPATMQANSSEPGNESGWLDLSVLNGEQTANLRQNPTSPTGFLAEEANSAASIEDPAAHPANEIAATDNQQPVPEKQQPFRRSEPKTGRNDSCPCGSGLKYKRCCLS